MPSVRELFPECEKRKRVRRGYAAQKEWSAPPLMNNFIAKLSTDVLDSHTKESIVQGRAVEMRRMIIKERNRFGYLCFKPGTINLAQVRSYDGLHQVYKSVRGTINWSNTWADCQQYVAAHCTSPAYVARVRQLRF
jgi:hypothetical protein